MCMCSFSSEHSVIKQEPSHGSGWAVQSIATVGWHGFLPLEDPRAPAFGPATNAKVAVYGYPVSNFPLLFGHKTARGTAKHSA